MRYINLIAAMVGFCAGMIDAYRYGKTKDIHWFKWLIAQTALCLLNTVLFIKINFS